MKCVNCKFFLRCTPTDGECRRYPPHYTPKDDGWEGSTPDRVNVENWCFPTVLNSDFCGEYRKKGKK